MSASIIEVALHEGIKDLMKLISTFEKLDNYQIEHSVKPLQNFFFVRILDTDGVELLSINSFRRKDGAKTAMLQDVITEIRDLIKAELNNKKVDSYDFGVACSNGDYADFTDIDSINIDIDMIAHHLSNICRFNGATSEHYSVAQHSVMVSLIVPVEHQLAALLHDAAEAFVGDMVRPIKGLMVPFQVLHDAVLKRVCSEFDIAYPLHPCVQKADDILLATEVRDLMPPDPVRWANLASIKPMTGAITPLTPQQAKQAFINRFYAIVNSTTQQKAS